MKKTLFIMLFLVYPFIDAFAFWPMFKKDPSHTGQAGYVGTESAKLKWSVDINALTGWAASPVIGKDGTIYIHGKSRTRGEVILYAVSPSGKIVRQRTFPAKYKEPITTPAISPDGKYLYFYTVTDDGGRDRGVLYSLSLKEWKIAWEIKFEIDTGIAYMPLAVSGDGSIYVGTALYISKKDVISKSRLLAVSPGGKLKWTSELRRHVSTPAFSRDGKELYVLTEGKNGKQIVLAFDLHGKVLWRFMTKVDLDFYSTPTVGQDGTIYLPADEKVVYGMRYRGGGKFEVISYKTGYGVNWSNTSISPSGIVYVDSGPFVGKSALVSFDKDGKKRWEFMLDVPYLASAPLIDKNEKIYFLGSNGTFYCLNKEGKVVWEYEVYDRGEHYGYAPAMGEDGTIYIVGGDGFLYAIGQ